MVAKNDQVGWKGSIPPQNLEAEMGVIGSVCLMREAIDEVGELKSEHFYADRHQKLWDVIQALAERRHGFDAVTLAEELDKRKQLEEVGGVEYLGKVLDSVPNAAHARYYAGIIISKWRSRQAKHGCAEVVKLIDDGAEDDDIATKAENVLTAIAERATPIKTVLIRDVMTDVWRSLQDRMKTKTSIGMPTGFEDVDKLIVGIEPKQLVIVAARPSMGKTSFVCCLALNLLKREIPVLFVSIEMGSMDIAEQVLCIESGVPSNELKSGCYSGNSMEVEMKQEDLLLAAGRIGEYQLLIDDQPGPKMREIAAKARRAKRMHNIGLMVVDYLQLIEPEDAKVPREQQVAQYTRALKALSKELGIPVIVLAQLNRGVELREDKRPRLADLRESGSIEQDADIVMFLHRPAAYDPADRPGECDLIIAKNRRGKIGTVTLAWRAESTQFKDMAAKHDATAEAASNAFPKRQSRDWDR